MTKITVSDEVFKALESSKKTADELLRECLGIGVGGCVLRSGVILPEGTSLIAFYKERPYYATIKGGAIDLMNELFYSPSAAAEKITGGRVNGWTFWSCKLPGEANLIPLHKLRKGRSSRTHASISK